MADNVAIVEQVYQHFDRGDIPAVLALFDADIRWHEAEGNPWWHGEPAVGVEEVAQVFGRILADLDDYSVRVGRVVGLGDAVLVECRYLGSGKVSGLPLDAQAAHVWDLQDGRITRFQQYADTAQMRRVIVAGE